MRPEFLDISEIGERLRRREISSVELTQHMIERAKALNPQLKPFVAVTEDLALEQAAAADADFEAEIWKGALQGVPVAVKDNILIEGHPAAAGMPLRKDAVSAHDATVVTRLREAGAVMLGRLKTTEGAHAEHRPPLFETPINPWNPELWPGASSSGAGVSVSAGMCFAALGTETGGSIRLPTAATGATSMKPTWGRVSRYGLVELAGHLDCIGPLTRSARDIGFMMQAISGPDENDPTAAMVAPTASFARMDRRLDGMRIGLDRRNALDGVAPTIVAAFDEAMRVVQRLGAEIVDIILPETDEMVDAYLPLSGVQTAIAHEDNYPARASEYGTELTQVVEMGRRQSAVDYQRLVNRQFAYRGLLNRAMAEVDAIVLPVLPFPAPTLRQMAEMTPDVIRSIIRFTAPNCLSGHPALALPCGFQANFAPISFEFVGHSFQEAALVRIADAYQSATAWHRRHPDLA